MLEAATMSEDLQIHFSLDGQKYDIGLKKADGFASQNKVKVGGIEYSIEGGSKEIEFIKEIFMKISQDCTENLSQAGKELKAKLWLAGATDINLSTVEGTHKIGIRSLIDDAPINIRQTIKELSSAMEEKYIFPHVAKMCTEFLQQQFKEGAYDAISDLETFAQTLTSDIRLISEDKHIFVFLETEKRSDISPVEETEQKEADVSRPTFSSKSEYRAPSNSGTMGANNLPYELQVGILKEDSTIGYMDLNLFGVCKERNDSHEMKEDVAWRRQAYVDAASKLKGVDTIIIDLRNNGGGDPSAVQLLCSLFIDEGLPLNRIEWRTEEGPKSEDFNTLSLTELPEEKRLLDKKIYVLIGPNTFSAAEEFSNNMKVLGRATIVGEPSGGGAHPGDIFKISNDLTIFIPTGRAINPIQQGNWEGDGIIPDHMIPEGKAFDEAVSLIQGKK